MRNSLGRPWLTSQRSLTLPIRIGDSINMLDRRRFISALGLAGASALWLPGTSVARCRKPIRCCPSSAMRAPAMKSAKEFSEAAKRAAVSWEIDAGPSPIGHNPRDRGRKTGPDNHWWYDYGRYTNGHICYGPYRDLPRGRYEYWFHIKYDIPNCGVADNRALFGLDAARREGDSVGRRIPGSDAVGTWKWFCDSEYNDGGVYDALIGYEFEVSSTAPDVELRLRQLQPSSSSISLECIVKTVYLNSL